MFQRNNQLLVWSKKNEDQISLRMESYASKIQSIDDQYIKSYAKTNKNYEKTKNKEKAKKEIDKALQIHKKKMDAI